jgi:3-isopropylmalate dehydratase small subunit
LHKRFPNQQSEFLIWHDHIFYNNPYFKNTLGLHRKYIKYTVKCEKKLNGYEVKVNVKKVKLVKKRQSKYINDLPETI